MYCTVRGDLDGLKRCLSDAAASAINTLVKHHESGRTRTAIMVLTNGECIADEKTKCGMAKLLVDAGASPTTTSMSGYNVFHFASCSSDLMRILLSAIPLPNVNLKLSSGLTALHIHAAAGNVENCQLLIKAKADVNEIDAFGNTPLMHATTHGEPRAVELLLASGSDLTTENIAGATALTIGPKLEKHTKGNEECRKLVVEYFQQVLLVYCVSAEFLVCSTRQRSSSVRACLPSDQECASLNSRVVAWCDAFSQL